jgi:hypothetical protein
MEWEYFIDDDEEEIKALFEYVGVSRRVKVLGVTNKRAFAFKKTHNDYKFVSSQLSVSQIEYGVWRVPYWLWFLVIGSFIISLFSLINEFSVFNFLFFIPPCATLILCILYRKFEFINTAVGCEPFRVVTRRESVVEKFEEFINELHSTPTDLWHTTDDFIQTNYFDRLIKRFIAVVTFLYSPLPFYVDFILMPMLGM